MHLAGSHATVKAVQHAPVPEQVQHILRDVAQVVHAVAVALQAAHQLFHPVPGPQDVQPVVQHALHLKGTARSPGLFQHPVVAVKAGDEPGIQQLPFLAAKGQVVDLFLSLGFAQAVHQIAPGVKVDHHAAQVKHDTFIHTSCLALFRVVGEQLQYTTTRRCFSTAFCMDAAWAA